MSIKSPFEHADLRVRRTHKLLWEALMAELSERTFEEITVTDICERAMVHRTTFYKHYEDKYALLEQGIGQMYDDLLAEEEHKPPSAYSIEHPPPYFIRLFEHAAQHQHFYRLMLGGEGIGRFQKLLKEYIAEVVSTQMGELPPANQHFAVPIDMHAHFVAGATLSLMTWWLEHDMPFSPHEMAQYLLSPHSALSFPSGPASGDDHAFIPSLLGVGSPRVFTIASKNGHIALRMSANAPPDKREQIGLHQAE